MASGLPAPATSRQTSPALGIVLEVVPDHVHHSPRPCPAPPPPSLWCCVCFGGPGTWPRGGAGGPRRGVSCHPVRPPRPSRDKATLSQVRAVRRLRSCFWATWRVASTSEMQALQRLEGSMAPGPLGFLLGVLTSGSVDWLEDADEPSRGTVVGARTDLGQRAFRHV